MTCITCQQDKSAREFGRNPQRANGRDPRCKMCIREQSKLSIRTNHQLPRFIELIETWPTEQLKSERDWLIVKATAIEMEIQRRR